MQAKDMQYSIGDWTRHMCPMKPPVPRKLIILQCIVIPDRVHYKAHLSQAAVAEAAAAFASAARSGAVAPVARGVAGAEEEEQ